MGENLRDDGRRAACFLSGRSLPIATTLDSAANCIAPADHAAYTVLDASRHSSSTALVFARRPRKRMAVPRWGIVHA